MTPTNKAARWLPRKDTRHPKCDLNSLFNPSTNDIVLATIKTCITKPMIKENDLNEKHLNLVNTLTQAKNKLPKIKQTKHTIPPHRMNLVYVTLLNSRKETKKTN